MRILIMLLCLFLCGCIHIAIIPGKCVEHVAYYSAEFKAAGIPHFVCSGYYRGKPHRWIKYLNGHIYDPTAEVLADTDPIWYHEERCEVVMP